MKSSNLIRWGALAALGLILLGGLLVSGGYLYLRESTLPQRDGTLELEGLKEPAKVLREPSGVAHIKANNEHDLFFALGAIHAQDRLWQMEFQRRLGAGRLSEVLGEQTVGRDKFMRTWGFYRAAEEAYRNLSPKDKDSVDAYVSGINTYLATDPPLPVEFRFLGYKPERWRPADVLVSGKMMNYQLSTNLDSELKRYYLRAHGLRFERIAQLMPAYPEDAPTILRTDDSKTRTTTSPTLADGQLSEDLRALNRSLPRFVEASNSWVVSGKLTATGKPLLANDPHLGLQVPTTWYLAHLESPTLDTTGATIPGFPGVVVGRNESISWGVTNLPADVQDLYIMNETSDGAKYRYQNEVRPYEVRREKIGVEDAKDIHITVRESVYGPVISDVVNVPRSKPLAIRWTGLDPKDRMLEALLKADHAGNWDEFNEALNSYNGPSMNFVYADVDGNIGYVGAGKFPIRKAEHTGLYPVPGDGEWDWRGWIPAEEWPRVLNPEEGFVVTANNKVTPEGYPHNISLEWAEPYRAERIGEMIETKKEETKKELSFEDMVSIQQDQHTLLYRDFRPILERLDTLSWRDHQWQERLLSWDGNTRPFSQESTVFEAWYSELSQLPGEEVGEEYWDEPRYLLRALSGSDPNCDDGATARRENCTDYAAGAFHRAVNRLGKDVPEWGEVHQATFEHPVLTYTRLSRFSDRQVPFGGDMYTVNVGSYDPGNFDMNAGPSYRQVVDLSNPNDSRFVEPMGQSGNLLSGQFDDLLPVWEEGRYLPMRSAGYTVDHSLTLEPGS